MRDLLIRQALRRGKTLVAAGLAIGSLGLAGAALPAVSASAAAANPRITTPPPVGTADRAGGTIPAGYTEQELFFEGDARSFRNTGVLGTDGRWSATADATAPYRGRMLVRRPTSAAKFNGTVMVEWLNVTGGADLGPDWRYAGTEYTRQGYAWVGISAQWVGVEGGPRALKTTQPERYASLQHPGDAFSYDIFSQAGQALRAPNGPDPLGGLRIGKLIATGESQSAFRMVTYVNAVHPLAKVYDGYLIHSRAAFSADLSQVEKGQPGTPPSVPATAAIPVPVGATIRTDLGVPAFTVQTETDLGTLFGFDAARQPDTSKIRTWELTGTGHGDSYILGFDDPRTRTGQPCGPDPTTVPINAGPHTYSIRAAVRHLRNWVTFGIQPPKGTPITTVDGIIQRDAKTGIALGGVRLPDVTVPSATLTGDRGPGSPLCFLLGRTDPWNHDVDAWDGLAEDPSGTPEPDTRRLYLTHDLFVSRFAAATKSSVSAGFVLAEDRQEFVDFAERAPVPN